MVYYDFNPFCGPNRVYSEKDMSYDQKMDFSWAIKVSGHFQNFATLGNFSKLFGNFFCISKMDIHITNFDGKMFWWSRNQTNYIFRVLLQYFFD